MWEITRKAIEKSRVTITILLLIIVFGFISYIKLPKAEDPGFTIRRARITTFLPGASPERIENLITDKIEEAIQEIPEVLYITSESLTGVSIVTVKINERYKIIRPMWDTLRRKMERIQRDLPNGTKGPIVNDEFGDVFGTIVSITGDGYSYRDLKNIAEEVRRELLFIDEVAKVELYGAQQERIFVEYNDTRLAELGSSSLQLHQVLESRNILSPGGAIETEHERIILEPSGNFESIDEIEHTVMNFPGSQNLSYLKDLTTVSRGYDDPPDKRMFTNGQPSIGLAISLREGGNTTVLGEKVQETVQRLQNIYPIGIDFHVVAFQPDEVGRKVNDFLHNLIQSVVIVLLMMLLWLGLRTGLVVTTLIPMSILLSFIWMSIFNIGIDQISLASLIIALGMLVDNSIVISESIMTEVSEGKEPKRAAIDSAKELSIPMLTSSLTTSAAFLPIFLAKSISGEYTSSLFSVVTIALMSSWILSLTMIPMLCVIFLKFNKKSHDNSSKPWHQVYRNFLLFLLKRPLKSVSVFVLLFIVSLGILKTIPRAFFPPSDRPLFTAELELPVGTKVEKTEEVVHQIDDFIKKELLSIDESQEGINSWATFIGGLAPRYVLNFTPTPPRPERAFIMFNTSSEKIIPELIAKIDNYVFENIPDLNISMQPTQHGPPVTSPVAIRLSGHDIKELFNVVEEVKSKLASIPGTKNIRDDWGAKSKKILVNINQPRALRAGITSRDIAISLQTLLSGFQTTEYREKDEIIPVTVRSTLSNREDLDKLETLYVYSQSSTAAVPLKQVADIDIEWQQSNILRRNRVPTVTIKSDVDQGLRSQVITDIVAPWIANKQMDWPRGFFYEFGGELESSKQARGSIIDKIPIAALIILLLLVMQFNSFRLPLIILLTIPLGVIGVTFGLYLTGSYMGFMTFLGIVSLSGIVINNAIVLLDRIIFEREQHKRTASEAVIVASQRRLRPILLTTMTTIGGLIPLWLGGGRMFEPMTIAIIFGLMFATFLTLGFVPVLYTLFYNISFKNVPTKPKEENYG